MLTSMSPSVLIREARREAGLTQAELAARAGVTQPVVARLEQPSSNPTLATIESVLDAAGYELELRAARRARPPVDESQIIERLRWTPAERLDAFIASNRNLNELLSAARRGRVDA